MHSDAEGRDEAIASLNKSLASWKKQLLETESKLAHRASEMKIVEATVQSLQIEKIQWKEEQAEKEALIKALEKARRKSVKVINELKKPKPESNRSKTLRRYYNLQPDEFGSGSGLDGYMEPFVFDVTKSQAQYDIAQKNLRRAIARERLVHPRT
jgi:chromosome segregation ATPase